MSKKIATSTDPTLAFLCGWLTAESFEDLISPENYSAQEKADFRHGYRCASQEMSRRGVSK